MTTPDPAEEPHRFLEYLFQAAVRRALPLHNTAAFLPPPPPAKPGQHPLVDALGDLLANVGRSLKNLFGGD